MTTHNALIWPIMKEMCAYFIEKNASFTQFSVRILLAS